jgi:hypothetical protein
MRTGPKNAGLSGGTGRPTPGSLEGADVSEDLRPVYLVNLSADPLVNYHASGQFLRYGMIRGVFCTIAGPFGPNSGEQISDLFDALYIHLGNLSIIPKGSASVTKRKSAF